MIVAEKEKEAGDTPTENPDTGTGTDTEDQKPVTPKQFAVSVYGSNRETPVVDGLKFNENTLFSEIISTITTTHSEEFANVLSFNTVADGSGTEIKSTSSRKLVEDTTLYAIFEKVSA